jgi:thiol-disulfide isomerase/thioredoxin
MIRALLLATLLLASPVASPAGAAELEPFSRGSFAALKAEAAGQPLVVHFWALSCAPCLAELPAWAGLARHHPGLRLALVNTDPPEAEPEVRRMLERMGVAGLRNLAFADRYAARLRFEVDPDWQGELPRTDLVAGNGQVTPVLGMLPRAELEAWLDRQSR